MKPVAIVMGSQTDWTVLHEAEKTLHDFGIPTHVEVVSAHRTPHRLMEFSENAHERFSVIIAGAGGAAHLPGMIASVTLAPVLGVPIVVGKMQGIDALLSIVMMPKGVPVATLSIDGAVNAALFAVKILATQDPTLWDRLASHQKSLRLKVKKMNQSLAKERRNSKPKTKRVATAKAKPKVKSAKS